MKAKERASIVVRRSGDSELTVKFPENIAKDFELVSQGGVIPTEFLNAALARSLVARHQLAAGCNNKCSKDCLW